MILSDPDYYPPTVNAANILAEKGHSIRLIGILYPNVHRQQINERIERINFGRHRTGIRNVWQYFSFYWWYLFRTMRKKPDWIIAYDGMAAGPVAVASKFSRRPWLYHNHDMTLPVGWYKLVAWIEKRLARTAAATSFPQEDRAEKFMKEASLTVPPLIVYNGPRSSWSERTATIHAELSEWVAANKFIVLYQGQFSTYFNLESLISSLALLPDDICLCMIGRELEEGMINKYQALIAKAGLHKRVKLLSPVSYDAVPSITRNCHIGVAKLGVDKNIPFNDYYLTGASNKISEYLNCGLPVLMAATEVNLQFYLQRGFAIFSETGSPESVASAIRKVYEHPEIYRSLKVAAAKAGKEIFNYDVQFEKIARLLENSSHT